MKRLHTQCRPHTDMPPRADVYEQNSRQSVSTLTLALCTRRSFLPGHIGAGTHRPDPDETRLCRRQLLSSSWLHAGGGRGGGTTAKTTTTDFFFFFFWGGGGGVSPSMKMYRNVFQYVVPRSGELQTQKSKSHLVRTQSLNVLSLKPGVGQYVAIHATLTDRNFFLAYFYTSSPFACIFSKPLDLFPALAVADTWFLCRPAE